MNSDEGRAFRRLLLLLTAAGLGLRLFRLNYFSYWLDEIMQASFVHGSWKDFWGSLRFDAVHPPLDYLICRFVEFANPSDAVRKLPAVAWGTLTIPFLGILIARRAGRLAGVSSAALLAIAPFHIRYSQELRPYALATLLVIVSLLALNSLLERPGAARVAAVYLSVLATAYTLYLGGLIAALGCAGMLLEDCFDGDPARRKRARRAAAWSPAFVVALALAYLPWLPVVRIAAFRPPESAPPPMSIARYGALFSFFSSAPGEGHPFSGRDSILLLAAAVGLLAALRRRRLRFLVIWAVTGFVAIEIVEQLHPHFPAARNFLQVGPALLALAGVGIASLAYRTKWPRPAAITLLICIGVANSSGVRDYFDHGRPDWRPLATYLRSRGSGGRVLAENQWIQLCLGFYLDGVASFHERGPKPWEIITLQGDPGPIGWLWQRGHRTWLVTCECGAQSEQVEEFAAPYNVFSFPTAENSTLALLP